MPILIDNSENSYLAIDAAILVDAFEGALSELELADRKDLATRLLVANHIITLAKAGEQAEFLRRQSGPPLTSPLSAYSQA